MPDFVAQLVVLLLGGGLVAGAASLVTARALARKSNVETDALAQKAPAEADSVVVHGAETAVLTMERALQSAERRISTLEEEREQDRLTISLLQSKVTELQEKVQHAETATAEAREAGRQLEVRLTDMARRFDHRD